MHKILINILFLVLIIRFLKNILVEILFHNLLSLVQVDGVICMSQWKFLYHLLAISYEGLPAKKERISFYSLMEHFFEGIDLLRKYSIEVND